MQVRTDQRYGYQCSSWKLLFGLQNAMTSSIWRASAYLEGSKVPSRENTDGVPDGGTPSVFWSRFSVAKGDFSTGLKLSVCGDVPQQPVPHRRRHCNQFDSIAGRCWE